MILRYLTRVHVYLRIIFPIIFVDKYVNTDEMLQKKEKLAAKILLSNSSNTKL